MISCQPILLCVTCLLKEAMQAHDYRKKALCYMLYTVTRSKPVMLLGKRLASSLTAGQYK